MITMSKKEELKELMKKVAEEKGAKGLNKRDSEIRYMLWIDKALMKKLKLKAIEEETTVKALMEISVRFLLKEF